MTTETTQTTDDLSSQQTTTTPETTSTSSDTDLGASEQTSQTSDATDLGSEDATGEAKDKKEEPTPAPGAEFQGAPEGEAAYEPVQMPDGYEADQALIDLVTPIGKKLNLNQAGMQELANLKPKMDQMAIERWKGHLSDLKKEAQADPEIGGAKYAPAIAAGKAVIAKFGNANFVKMINHYGIGAHPEMIRFMDKIAKATGETPTPSSEGGGMASVEKPLHELMYATERK